MEFVAFLFVLAALTWSAVYFRHRGIWGLCIATLLAGTVFGYAFFRMGMLTSDRLLWAACIVVYIALRRLGSLKVKVWDRSDTLVSLFLVVMCGTTLTHEWRLADSFPMNKLVFYFIMPMGLYWTVRQLEITTEDLCWLYKVLSCLGLYLAITAVFEKYELYWAVFPRYISDIRVAEFFGRGRGPLLNPVGNGILMTIALGCVLMHYPKLSRLGRMGVVVAVFVLLFGVYCTLTRCVWIGAVAVLFGIIWLAMPSRLRLPAVIFSVAAGMLLIGMNADKLKSFKRDKNVSVQDMEQSAELRPILAVVAWRVFSDHPLTGVGTGQYLAYSGEYLHQRQSDLPLEKGRAYVQHNMFLATLVENGLLAFIPFVLLLTLWSWRSWRLWRSPAISLEFRQLGLVFMGAMCAYFVNGMFHDVLIIPMVNMYIFFLAGCVRSVAAEHVGFAPAEWLCGAKS